MSAHYKLNTMSSNKLSNSSDEKVIWNTQENDTPTHSSENQNFLDWTDINTDDQNLYSDLQRQTTLNVKVPAAQTRTVQTLSCNPVIASMGLLKFLMNHPKLLKLFLQ